MSIDAYEQLSTGVYDITSITLVTLEIIHNALLINELRLWFADAVKRSQCEAPDYCPTSVYEPQDCPGVLDKRTKASAH